MLAGTEADHAPPPTTGTTTRQPVRLNGTPPSIPDPQTNAHQSTAHSRAAGTPPPTPTTIRLNNTPHTVNQSTRADQPISRPPAYNRTQAHWDRSRPHSSRQPARATTRQSIRLNGSPPTTDPRTKPRRSIGDPTAQTAPLARPHQRRPRPRANRTRHHTTTDPTQRHPAHHQRTADRQSPTNEPPTHTVAAQARRQGPRPDRKGRPANGTRHHPPPDPPPDPNRATRTTRHTGRRGTIRNPGQRHPAHRHDAHAG